MLVSLPMYDRPELCAAHSIYWHNIHLSLQERGINSPKTLDNSRSGQDFWLSPHLILSQTCGMPYRKFLYDQVNLVGTPDYGLDNCPPGFYCSHFIVRKSDNKSTLLDYRHALFAFNDENSQSGFAAPWSHLKRNNTWFDRTLKTGAHLKSLRAVACGEADIAAIDAVTWRFAKKYDAFAGDLCIVETTFPTPGLPYITSIYQDPKELFDAVKLAIMRTDSNILDKLYIRNIVQIDKEAYLNVPNPDFCYSKLEIRHT